jgi:two-component system chemotaxis response regulator CheB
MPNSDFSASRPDFDPASERRDIIVVGASAGGVEALAEFAAHLPAHLPVAVFIVLHMPAYGHSVLPEILNRRGPLPAAHPQEGEVIQPGHIYVALPDHHLLMKAGHILLTRGPAEHTHRPAIDTLFRSAARAYGPRVVGVVLSGTLDDGTAGLQAIKMRGGLALVQDPAEAMFAGMPQSAIESVAVDAVQPIAELVKTLARLAGTPTAQENPPVTPNQEEDVTVSEMNLDTLDTRMEGKPSGFSCPDCHGVLWEISEGELVRFRCRVGHAFSPDSLLASQSESLEEALWAALRALEESAALAERLQSRSAERGHVLSAQRFSAQAQDARARAATIFEALTGGQIISRPAPYADTSLPSAAEADPEL